MKWIKVTDRLPKAFEEVLIVINGSIVSWGYKSSNDPDDLLWRDMLMTNRGGVYDEIHNVTHWIPIPKSPGE